MHNFKQPFINQSTTQNDLLHNDNCDKYDYLVAVACGVIGGLIDIFLVGMPPDNKLVGWTDAQTDYAVKMFARFSGWKPAPVQSDSLANAIAFLEQKFKVNYDQRYGADVSGLFTMSTRNHHMMSLAHSPDILGLFFSILNQFTSTSSFIADGQLITIQTDTFALQGGNIISKLFCGVANWLGHIMSDIAGSSGSRRKFGRGTGVTIPFYEVFQFCKVGQFEVGRNRQDFATIAVRAFEEGYDFRFGLAMAIPVLITEISIRLIWSLRQHFGYQKSLRECIPTAKHNNLRVMLLIGNVTLCSIDILDAGMRSGGNLLFFLMRLNLIGWYHFLTLVIKEICIQTGFVGAMQREIRVYQRTKAAMDSYLMELKEIDMALFQKETRQYAGLLELFETDLPEKEVLTILNNKFKEFAISQSWQGDFNTYMADKNAILIFE